MSMYYCMCTSLKKKKKSTDTWQVFTGTVGMTYVSDCLTSFLWCCHIVEKNTVMCEEDEFWASVISLLMSWRQCTERFVVVLLDAVKKNNQGVCH